MPLSSLYRQSLPVLLLSGGGLVVAGVVLQRMEGVLAMTPGLLVMVPVLIALRGGISGTMGTRLGSAFHMGLVSRGNFWNDETRQATLAALLLSVVLSAVTGILGHTTTVLLQLPSAGFLRLFLVATLAGTAAGVVQLGLTFGIILFATQRGLDPDNVTTPALATVGDVVTILLIFLVAGALGGFP